LENLEDRSLPSSYSAATTSDLIADINAANAAGGTNTIALTAPTGSNYDVLTVNNNNGTYQYGNNGLPVIAANDNLTIVGNRATIDNPSSQYLRYFFVASGASLTVQDLTLVGGASTNGGAIYSQGALTLSDVVFGDNRASISGGYAVGGAVYIAAGTANISNSLFRDNSGGGTAYGSAVYVAAGTVAFSNDTVENNSATYGGGLYIAGGTVTFTNDTVENNWATYGGGLYIAGGAVAFSNDTVENNWAGNGGGLYIACGTVTFTSDTVEHNSASNGGGLYIGKGATVDIDAFTLANTIDNTASVDPNIFGHYTKLKT
jgi:hypothetical protein